MNNLGSKNPNIVKIGKYNGKNSANIQTKSTGGKIGIGNQKFNDKK